MDYENHYILQIIGIWEILSKYYIYFKFITGKLKENQRKNSWWWTDLIGGIEYSKICIQMHHQAVWKTGCLKTRQQFNAEADPELLLGGTPTPSRTAYLIY